jgi:hypothetical protein
MRASTSCGAANRVRVDTGPSLYDPDSRHAISFNDRAIYFNAKAGTARDRDHPLYLTNRLNRQMIAKGVFLLLEFEHGRSWK